MNIDALFELYENHGGKDYIGEPVSQVQHMVRVKDKTVGSY